MFDLYQVSTEMIRDFQDSPALVLSSGLEWVKNVIWPEQQIC